MEHKIFHIAVCDDERQDRERIEAMTRETCEREQIYCEITVYADPRELCLAIQNGREFDLLLIDVMMPEKNGMELARELRREEHQMEIVFISSNRNMALQGYEVSAARYLAKPVEQEILQEAIHYCYEKQHREEEILIPYAGGKRRLIPGEVRYIYISGRKVCIVQEKEEWETGLGISQLTEQLADRGFIRCHQSFLVNSRYIRTFLTNEIEMIDGKKLPVSKHRVKEARKEYFAYMSQ